MIWLGLLLSAGSPGVEKATVIAWGPADEVAVRKEAEAFAGADEDEGIEGTPFTKLEIEVYRCGEQQPFKTFAVTTAERHEPAHRKAGWDAAEAWLVKQRFTFVAGDKATKAQARLTTVGVGRGGALASWPVPSALAPATAAWAQLELVSRLDPSDANEQPGYELFAVAAQPDGGTTDRKLGRIAVRDYQLLGAPKCDAFSWSPRNRCLAFICVEPYPMATFVSHVHTLAVDKPFAAGR